MSIIPSIIPKVKELCGMDYVIAGILVVTFVLLGMTSYHNHKTSKILKRR
jgi:hypothetical protein